MLLCLDVGNTHILGGVFDKSQLVARFRYATHLIGTADQFGTFLLHIAEANHLAPRQIEAAVVCSVVPSCDYTIKHAISAYLNIPLLNVTAQSHTGLHVHTKNPHEMGADLIAGALGATHAFPNENLIIVDMGTATTVCAVTRQREILGVAILPGMRLGMESLKINTAKLMTVDIEEPSHFIGKTTRESIQSGLYYGKLGALKELIAGFMHEAFPDEPARIIGTGGFSQLYKNNSIFDVILPDLVLQGLHVAYQNSNLSMQIAESQPDYA